MRVMTGALLVLVWVRPVPAQETGDQARLMLTVGAGFVGGGNLWTVGKQPILDEISGISDTFALRKEAREGIGAVFSGTYYPGSHVGFVAEAVFLGLGSRDGCQGTIVSGSLRNSTVCTTINGHTRSPTTVALSGGAVYRFAIRKPIEPYVTVQAGLAITQVSYMRVIGNTDQNADFIVYSDETPRSTTLYGSFGGGIAAFVGKAYRLRMEARDHYLGITRVVGPGVVGGRPPNRVEGKHVFSLMFGLDVVLERRRGRRY
jgi:hypothetical protein